MKDCGGYDDLPIVAEAYDQVYEAMRRDDVRFFVAAAKECGGPVLELGCGTGRVLIPTAQAGIKIVGFDLSEHMMKILRDKLELEADEVQDCVELVEGDMRTFDLGRTFKLITIPFRPFQHLITAEDQMSCLRSIHRHLDADGRLILDLFNPSLKMLADDSKLDEWGEDPELTLDDGRVVYRRYRIARRDYFEQVQDVEIIYYVTHPDGRQERLVHAFPMRYLFRWEVEHMLYRCGFEVEDLYAGYDKSPFGSKDPGELVFVAKRG